jgi:glyoxylase I family protein
MSESLNRTLDGECGHDWSKVRLLLGNDTSKGVPGPARPGLGERSAHTRHQERLHARGCGIQEGRASVGTARPRGRAILDKIVNWGDALGRSSFRSLARQAATEEGRAMLCKKLHHAAYRCRDAAETARFYTEVLGLKFTHVMGADHVPSTGAYSPHIHVFFQMEDGSHIAFFECPKDAGNMKDEEMPDWIQHFAFEVESMAALEKAKKDLEAKGIDVLGITDHGGVVSSIYFFDPSGHRLELAAQTLTDKAELARHEGQAPKLLAIWSKTRDWSAGLPATMQLAD